MQRSVCRCFPTAARFSYAATSTASTSRISLDDIGIPPYKGKVVPDLLHVTDKRTRDALRQHAANAAIMNNHPPEQVQREYEEGKDDLLSAPVQPRQARRAKMSAPSLSSASAEDHHAQSEKTQSSGPPSSPATPSIPVPTPKVPVVYEIPPTEDPLLSFMTNLMMTSGKKATARRHVSDMLGLLSERTSTTRPMEIVRQAIRAASPDVRISQQKRGAKSVSVPIALGERQKVRQGIMWILQASDKRTSESAGGSKRFGKRVALEIEAVLNGNSEVLKKKDQLHAAATVNRANVAVGRQ